MLSPLCLLFLGRLTGYIVNLCVFSFYKFLGKLTDLLQHLPESTSGLFHFRRTAFSI